MGRAVVGRARNHGEWQPAPELPVARIAVDVALAHLDRPFDYRVPAHLHEAAVAGVRVRVRFAGRLVDGYLLERTADSAHDGALAWVERVVSPEPVLTPEVARLCRAVADRYAGVLADVLRLAVPPRHARVETEAETGTGAAAAARAPTGGEVGADIATGSGSAAEVVAEPGSEPPRPEPTPAPASSPDAAASPAAAWGRYPHGAALLEALGGGRVAHVVWQALPGESWPARLAEAAAATVGAGRGALLVVPDQRDVQQLLAACVDRVGADRVVALTAELGPAERYRRWLAVRRGRVPVVVGTRSAAFAPVARLGLLAVWDDGDDLHAEPRAPYPHVRDVLVARAHQAGAALLVGGYGRTAEAQLLVESGWAREVVADRAAVRAAMPRVTALGETDGQLHRDPDARAARLPAVAFEAARAALVAGRPVLVQSPRAGYLPWLACGSCRETARCRHCAGPLGFAGSRPAAVTPAAPRPRARRGAAGAGGRRARSGARPAVPAGYGPARSGPDAPRRSWAGRSRAPGPAVRRWCTGAVRGPGTGRAGGGHPGRGATRGRRLRGRAAAGRVGPAVPARPAGGRGDTAPLVRGSRAGGSAHRRRSGRRDGRVGRADRAVPGAVGSRRARGRGAGRPRRGRLPARSADGRRRGQPGGGGRGAECPGGRPGVELCRAFRCWARSSWSRPPEPGPTTRRRSRGNGCCSGCRGPTAGPWRRRCTPRRPAALRGRRLTRSGSGWTRSRSAEPARAHGPWRIETRRPAVPRAAAAPCEELRDRPTDPAVRRSGVAHPRAGGDDVRPGAAQAGGRSRRHHARGGRRRAGRAAAGRRAAGVHLQLRRLRRAPGQPHLRRGRRRGAGRPGGLPVHPRR